MKDIFRSTIPVMLGYVPLGVAFGIYAAALGISPLWVGAMSLVVYGGSAQFLLVALIAQGAGVGEIFVAIFLLNARHIFYTLAMLDTIKELKWRTYAIFALTDETFALLKSRNYPREKLDFAFNATCALNQLYWLAGTLAGACLGAFAGVEFAGVEFSLSALFIVIFYELYRANPNLRVVAIGLACAVAARLAVGEGYFLICALVLAVVALVVLRGVVEGGGRAGAATLAGAGGVAGAAAGANSNLGEICVKNLPQNLPQNPAKIPPNLNLNQTPAQTLSNSNLNEIRARNLAKHSAAAAKNLAKNPTKTTPNSNLNNPAQNSAATHDSATTQTTAAHTPPNKARQC